MADQNLLHLNRVSIAGFAFYHHCFFVAAPFYIFALRRLEKTDPKFVPPQIQKPF